MSGTPPKPAGTVIGNYRILSVLGQGAQAYVYRVVHTQRGTQHALKLLTDANDDLRTRMRREAALHASLDHPNLVRVDEVLEVDGAPGMVMELIEGPTLSRLLAAYRPSPSEARDIFVALLAAVNAAHRKGLIHRDLKPENILLQLHDDGVIPKIMDFGLVKDTASDAPLTQAGTLVGTPRYMAPEQIRDATSVDHRVDLYALGCILYELLTGKPAYPGDRTLSVLSNVFRGKREPLGKNVDHDLAQLTNELLASKPEDRPRTALDVIVRLERPATGGPVRLHPGGRAVFFDADTKILPNPLLPLPRPGQAPPQSGDDDGLSIGFLLGMLVLFTVSMGVTMVAVLVLVLGLYLLA